MFDAQPAQIKPVEVRTQSDYALVAHRDDARLYVRAAQSERALVRYQLFLRTDVTLNKRALPGVEAFELTCDWTVSPYLQRQPCVETLDGKLACAETYTVQLDDREAGQFKPADPEGATCRMDAPDLAEGAARLSTAVTDSATTRFDDDFKRRVRPDLAKAGMAVRARP
jgi:hypothetical protein